MASSSSVLKCLGPGYDGLTESIGDAMLASLRTVLQPKQAVYVSTPITTGETYLELMERTHDHFSNSVSSDEANEVVEENVRLACAFVTKTRAHFSTKPVIDPTALDDRPDWEQHHYHAFWLQVIREFVSIIVLRDGWQFSNGCVLEFVRSRSIGVQVLKENFSLLSDIEATDLLADSDERFKSIGMSMKGIGFGRMLMSSQCDNQKIDEDLDRFFSE